jgi:hypothetical protein
LSPGVLLQHIELCLDPRTVVCKHYKVPSSEKVTSVVTLTREHSPFSSSASLLARPVSFTFSSQSCSRAWHSWPSSTSCTTSTIVSTKCKRIQLCKALSSITRTFLLIGDFL